VAGRVPVLVQLKGAVLDIRNRGSPTWPRVRLAVSDARDRHSTHPAEFTLEPVDRFGSDPVVL
jgi:hypothetical protein